MEEIAKVIVREEIVLEKFDGEGPGAVLRERAFLVDGVIESREFFDEEGTLVNTVEGGN